MILIEENILHYDVYSIFVANGVADRNKYKGCPGSSNLQRREGDAGDELAPDECTGNDVKHDNQDRYRIFTGVVSISSKTKSLHSSV